MRNRISDAVIRNFEKDQIPLLRVWVDKLSFIGVILVPLFSLVDYFLYPEHFVTFLNYRCVATAACLAVFLVNRRWNLGRWCFHLAAAGYYVVGLSIIKMILDVGEYTTPYYAGLNLVLISFGVLLPVDARRVAFHCIFLYLLYFVLVLNFAGAGDISMFLSNNAFVFSSLLIIILGAFVSRNLRLKEYLLRIELENAKQQLQKYSEMLEDAVARKQRDLLDNLEEKKQVEEEKEKLETQLIQFQKLEAIGRLAGGVAHDFNNILTIISGCGDLLLMRMDGDDPNRMHVEDIKKAAGRASTLTRQLLAFSRKQIFKSIELDINEVVMDLDKMLRRLIGEDIEFITELDPDIGYVKADPSQLEQVIMNLVVNARDAIGKGGRIVVRTANVPRIEGAADPPVAKPAAAYARITVEDNGSGMSKQTMAQIFEPFFTTKELGKGTGLGLSTVYGIVNQSGGHIQVESEPGKGTSFHVYLPHFQPSQVREREAGPGEMPPDGSETILLVEDEEMVRALARDILQSHGYTVVACADAESAIEGFRGASGEIDLLITDVIMPKMSGPELASRLQTLRPGLKILYISGYAGEIVSGQGFEGHEFRFLEKPFSPSALVRKVRGVLDAGPAA